MAHVKAALFKRASRFGSAGLFETLRRMSAVAEERRALRALTDRELTDLGLSRDDVEKELARPFWDTDAR